MSLTLMPCGDLDQYGVHEHNEISQEINHSQAPTHHDQDQRDEADTCSPFCICACCGVIYNFEFNSILLPEAAVQMDKKFPSYASNLYSNEFLFIWKPPKISLLTRIVWG